MEDLACCFFPSTPLSALGEADETFLRFVEEAARSEDTSDEELVELVASLMPDHAIDHDGLAERLGAYREDLRGGGNSALQQNAIDVAMSALLENDFSTTTDAFSSLSDTLDANGSVSFDNQDYASSDNYDEQEQIVQQGVELLRGVVGAEDGSCDDVLAFAMTRIVVGDADETARWLLEHGLEKAKELKALDDKKRKEKARKEVEAENAARERIVLKFDERPEPILDGNPKRKDKGLKASKASSNPSESKIRYLDGKVVATNGAKYIEISQKETWDGGSKGRVKTKGKRGPGWVAA